MTHQWPNPTTVADAGGMPTDADCCRCECCGANDEIDRLTDALERALYACHDRDTARAQAICEEALNR